MTGLDLTFSRNALQTDPNLKCTVEVSYLEIYNGMEPGRALHSVRLIIQQRRSAIF